MSTRFQVCGAVPRWASSKPTPGKAKTSGSSPKPQSRRATKKKDNTPVGNIESTPAENPSSKSPGPRRKPGPKKKPTLNAASGRANEVLDLVPDWTKPYRHETELSSVRPEYYLPGAPEWTIKSSTPSDNAVQRSANDYHAWKKVPNFCVIGNGLAGLDESRIAESSIDDAASTTTLQNPPGSSEFHDKTATQMTPIANKKPVTTRQEKRDEQQQPDNQQPKHLATSRSWQELRQEIGRIWNDPNLSFWAKVKAIIREACVHIVLGIIATFFGLSDRINGEHIDREPECEDRFEQTIEDDVSESSDSSPTSSSSDGLDNVVVYGTAVAIVGMIVLVVQWLES